MDILLLAWVSVCGLALAFVDIREHRLPNRMVAVLGAGCLAIVAVDQITIRSLRIDLGALTATSGVAFAAAVVALARPRLLGMGDAKLLAALTPVMSCTSPTGVLTGLWLASAAAVVVVIMRRAIAGISMTRAVAFGPFLLVAALLSVALTR